MSNGAMGSSVLEDLVSKAILLGAEALDVEYCSGEEQVFAVRGSTGVGIGTFPTSSPEAVGLRTDLVELLDHVREIVLKGTAYELRCSASESFGETVFRVDLRPVNEDAWE